MKLLPIVIALLASSAYAARIENNIQGNGLQAFIISGNIAPAVAKSRTEFKYLYGNPLGNTAHLQEEFAKLDEKERKKNTRLRPEAINFGSLNFVAYRRLSDTLAVQSAVRMYAFKGPTLGATNNGGITVKPVGDVTLMKRTGKNLRDYLYVKFATHKVGWVVNDVDKTTTYSPFSTGTRSVSVEYERKLPEITLAAYYSPPTMEDVRVSQAEAGLQRSMGASATWKHSFAPKKNLELNIGYTNGDYRPNKSSTSAKQELGLLGKPQREQGVGVSAKWQHLNWTSSIDIGKKREDMGGKFIKGIDITNLGLRLDYEVTPYFKINGTVGMRRSQPDVVAGSENVFSAEETLAQDSNRFAAAVLKESLQFKSVDNTVLRLGASYELSKNVSVNGEYLSERIQNFVKEGAFTERRNDTITANVRYKF